MWYPRRLGVPFGAVCADVVESLNAILKGAYDDNSGGGGGMPVATQPELEADIFLQVLDSKLLKFDLRLCKYGTPHTAQCTVGKLVATRIPPPSPLAFPAQALFPPCHGRVGNAKDVVSHVGSQHWSRGVLCLRTLACVFRLIFAVCE